MKCITIRLLYLWLKWLQWLKWAKTFKLWTISKTNRMHSPQMGIYFLERYTIYIVKSDSFDFPSTYHLKELIIYIFFILNDKKGDFVFFNWIKEKRRRRRLLLFNVHFTIEFHFSLIIIDLEKKIFFSMKGKTNWRNF